MTITKVLLIDDEPHIRRIAQLSLAGVARWTVGLASSGPEGIELAARDQPDAILLDVMMPGMDGPTTLTALRARPDTAAIPVVFLTAKVQKHEVDRYLAMGAAGVIHKPFDPLTLHQQIDQIVSAWEGCRA